MLTKINSSLVQVCLLGMFAVGFTACASTAPKQEAPAAATMEAGKTCENGDKKECCEKKENCKDMAKCKDKKDCDKEKCDMKKEEKKS